MRRTLTSLDSAPKCTGRYATVCRTQRLRDCQSTLLGAATTTPTHTGIFVFQPSSADLPILLVDLQVDTLQMAIHLAGKVQSSYASPDAYDAQCPCLAQGTFIDPVRPDRLILLLTNRPHFGVVLFEEIGFRCMPSIGKDVYATPHVLLEASHEAGCSSGGRWISDMWSLGNQNTCDDMPDAG